LAGTSRYRTNPGGDIIRSILAWRGCGHASI
jgi:hypothetical protein